MNPWNKELWRLALFLIGGLIAGVFLEKVEWGLILGLVAYLFLHLRNLHRLNKWLQLSGQSQPPESEGIWADVTERVYRLQKQNRGRKKKLAKFITRFKESTSAMPDATVVLNQYGQIEWINKAAQKLLGLNPSQDIGLHIQSLMRSPDFVSYFTRGDFEHPLETHPPLNLHHHISVRIIPYGNNQMLLIARDVTPVKRLEQMRRDFISNISHELRTPLTVLRGYLEALQDENGNAMEEKMWRRTIDVMNQQALRMQNIVDDLLMLSRMETSKTQGAPESISIPELLRSIQSAAQALGKEKNQEISLEIDETLWLNGTRSELYSAFSNLIFNAVHYTPPNGRITVEWSQNEEGAHLKVTDTGIGIAPQHIKRITERFYRVDNGRSREMGGTGLGLAIVKHVLQRHDAKLTIFSEVNRGSTFSCDFPRERIHHPQPKLNVVK